MRKGRNGRSRSALSLYSGAGGLDLGLEAAGFDVMLCVELDGDCRQTLKNNRPEWTLAEPGDVNQLDPSEVLRAAALCPGDLTLLAGGPPCQPFSKSGYWARGDARRLEDPRAATLRRFLDFVETALPSVVLLENVKGLVFNDKDEGLTLLEAGLRSINQRHGVSYQTSIIHLNCADYGVPQLRERVFIIAQREGREMYAPQPTHYPEARRKRGADRHRTGWDAIGDLDTDEWPDHLNARGKWAKLLPTIPEGENYLWHTRRSGGDRLFGWRTRFWSFLLKLAKNRPSWTIQADPGPATGPFHWRSRRLSTRELCRLQTFPDDFEVAGKRRSRQRQIGNAVPPAMGEMLGWAIRRQLFDERPQPRASFVPRARDDCPPPEPLHPVPHEYWHLRGDHEDHPGPGQGPGAQQRAAGEPAGEAQP